MTALKESEMHEHLTHLHIFEMLTMKIKIEVTGMRKKVLQTPCPTYQLHFDLRKAVSHLAR